MSKNLENLVNVGQLKQEPKDQKEFDSLVLASQGRFKDCQNQDLSDGSRFDLAYAAAFGFSLAALRWHGFRPSNRYIVFQSLNQTIDLSTPKIAILGKCHEKRNKSQYEGLYEVESSLLLGLIQILKDLETQVSSLT